MRAGRGHVESGGDQAVTCLDHPGVAVGGAGLHDHHGLRGSGGGVDQGGPVGGGELVEHVGDGHQVGRPEGEGGSDPGALPAGAAQGAVSRGQFTAEVERGPGPVEHGHGTLPSQVAPTAQAAAPVPPPMSTWSPGVHPGTASANARSADRTASKVAGIR